MRGRMRSGWRVPSSHVNSCSSVELWCSLGLEETQLHSLLKDLHVFFHKLPSHIDWREREGTMAKIKDYIGSVPEEPMVKTEFAKSAEEVGGWLAAHPL